jgi:DNA-binding NarL/FixJ family response regulator
MDVKIRIVIADDHAVLRAGLRLLINGQPDMEVVGEAADGSEAVTRARETQPDVMLLDLSMPGQGGMQAITGIRQAAPNTRVLALTMYDDPAYLRSVLATGGAGYVVKSVADMELLTAIRAVANGRTFVDLPGLDRSPAEQGVQGSDGGAAQTERSLSLLSDRERTVLSLVAQGYTNQEVADQLEVSVKSVETYRARLMDKLGLQNRADLVRYALECGLLIPPTPPIPSP